MQPLEKNLRNKLERTVKEARDVAEAAARATLEHLGVGEAAPFPHLSETERELRRKLRIHGRQLGDSLNGKVQTMDRLLEEVAYQHWHRMLFARFLAENNLLMYPDPDDPVAVTLEECEELAVDEGGQNGWELAARFAARMLPQIFRPDSSVFQLVLPPEHQHKLERLVADLPPEVFTASDSLGWVYQFWQAKRKDEINASEVKIGARELPAVTQLFTEPYMVAFLLDNSLGAWWAARRLTAADLKNAVSEEELRAKAALPGMPLDYLRFVKQDDGTWTPAAGTFDGWPEDLREFKTLDPCCGSGHFLVAALLMVVPIRMVREGLSAREAVDVVLRENIHGLEIDQRCVELAAFALALTAWRYPDAGGYRPLPELNVACSGLAISAKKEDWLDLAGDNRNLELALEELYQQFKDAPVLGSLINPKIRHNKSSIFDMKWEEVGPLLSKALSGEKDDNKTEMGVVAQGLSKAATLLAGEYSLVITNVPYLTRSKQGDRLREFCSRQYSEAKNDIGTVFLDRCLEFCVQSCTCSIVLPQNWLFLTTFKEFREKVLRRDTWHMIARLGPGAFETISGEVVKAILLCISRGMSIGPIYISCFDVSSTPTAREKAKFLLNVIIKQVEQVRQLSNPDARVVLEKLVHGELLEKYSHCVQGLRPADRGLLIRSFWEIDSLGSKWKYLQSSSERTQHYSGMDGIIDIETFDLRWRELGSAYKGHKQWGKFGICMSQMSTLPATIYTGAVFDGNVNVFDIFDNANLSAIWSFCSSPEFIIKVRQIDQKHVITNATLVKVPFDLDHWTRLASEKYPNGLPKPYSDDPTQWIFHGHPSQSDEPLQVAMARLLGYRWPAELDSSMELSDEAQAWVKKSEVLMDLADKDGIVCIPPVRGEAPASDRLLKILVAAYGNTWSNDKLSELLKQADHAGKTLESWLREKFFTQHCKLFHHRPFIWHIWDGLRDGFSALVNYHKLDHKNLETLIYAYLGDWITRQKQDQADGVDGAGERLAAAENLKKRLELILEGEAPYDIFVRWKPLEKQPLGWNPDLNDGVRLNIRPFLSVPDVGKRGAGILRDKPNLNWNKDRGKDVESAPWFHFFQGDRINDHHLSLAEKRAACKVIK